MHYLSGKQKIEFWYSALLPNFFCFEVYFSIWFSMKICKLADDTFVGSLYGCFFEKESKRSFGIVVGLWQMIFHVLFLYEVALQKEANVS